MTIIVKIALIAACIAAAVSCDAALAQDTTKTEARSVVHQINIIPQPVRVTPMPGVFVLTEDTAIVVQPGSRGATAVAKYLAGAVKSATGFHLKIGSSEDRAPSCIVLSTSVAPDLGDEGYEMTVEPQRVVIRARRPAGLFYGVQTLRQLFAAEMVGDKLSIPRVGWYAPCVRIADYPRYQWRGMLLDVSRHFMPVATVKRYIDLLALHKMNSLQWHLTDDQGWRIEIKKYPKLTAVGAWRKEENGECYGGFYTQDQIRDVLRYAKDRHVNIVPEIEMPGHALAALASYPDLSCTGGPFSVSNHGGVFQDVYCPGSEQTFAFLQDVLTEVIDLFPSKIIHIGGDECPKDRWNACPKCQARMKAEGLSSGQELQSYFVKRVEKFLNSNGRRLIGWDEILEGGLAPNAAVMSWRGMDGGISAATQKHDVVMTPTSHCYLDYGQGPETLKNVYSFEPTPSQLTGDLAKHVLGVQGNVWTESIADQARADYQIFPRLCALAEVAWSPKEARKWEGFDSRMKVHYKRLDAVKVNYYVPGK